MSGTIYQLCVKGHLRSEWSEWFDGMSIEHAPDGDTLITGEVRDQAALHGLLSRVRDLGLTLVSVQRGLAEESKGGVEDC